MNRKKGGGKANGVDTAGEDCQEQLDVWANAMQHECARVPAVRFAGCDPFCCPPCPAMAAAGDDPCLLANLMHTHYCWQAVLNAAPGAANADQSCP